MKELIIRNNSSNPEFALLKDEKLIALHKNESNYGFSVGDIILAKVKKTLQGLNAAFIDIGYEKEGFLHYNDLNPHMRSMVSFVKKVTSKRLNNFSLNNIKLEPISDDSLKIGDLIKSNQSILVQIVKEPISTKGARLSSEISLAGRYLILMPFSETVSISAKIQDPKERDRLKTLIQSIKPKGFGVVIRTVAEGKKVADLDKNLRDLHQRWLNMCKKLQLAKPPTKILNEIDSTQSMIRDFFDDSFSNIHIEKEDVYNKVKSYITKVAPEKESIVKRYTSRNPIFEKFGIEKQIKTSFGRVVNINYGAYLVIEHTEALHVIDVNSGRLSNKEKNQQDTALSVNLIAAEEIARQLRLRDMGGIIVVDFIDMHNPESRRSLFDFLKKQMADDKAKHKILPPSRFGLIQITRQRRRQEKEINTSEQNPNEKSKVSAPILIIDEISLYFANLIKEKKIKKGIFLHTHPFIAAYLQKGLFSIQFKWFLKHKIWIKIVPRDAYTYLEYRFKNKLGNTLK